MNQIEKIFVRVAEQPLPFLPKTRSQPEQFYVFENVCIAVYSIYIYIV